MSDYAENVKWCTVYNRTVKSKFLVRICYIKHVNIRSLHPVLQVGLEYRPELIPVQQFISNTEKMLDNSV